MSESKEEKKVNKELDKVIAQLNSDYKRSVVVKGADGMEIERIPTELVSVDKLMGGGIPRRRWTMVYGPKGSGKTSLCYKIIATGEYLKGKIWLARKSW